MSGAATARAKIAEKPKSEAKQTRVVWPKIQKVEIPDKEYAAEIERAVSIVLARRFGKRQSAKEASKGA